MQPTWIVAADHTRGRIFSMDDKSFEEVCTFTHPEARVQEQALQSDRPGRAHESVGKARHALAPDVDSSEHERAVFAKEIGSYIEQARQRHQFKKLLLIAEPKMLGSLRKELSGDTMNLVKRELSKNITQQDEREIKRYVASVF